MDATVTLEPWEPWPLVIPALLLVAGIAMSIVGTRKKWKPMREGGYVVFIIGALACGAMAWSLSGIWDAEQRTRALESLGYESPMFGAGTSPVGIDGSGAGGDLPPIGFQAVRDGERVRGVMLHQGGDRWLVEEVEQSGPDDD
ncbi:hypothetical protein [Agromyces sp. LHK192]|uniref:hypothetical protein n=1 Tax=Agromyces sp. LHK192 TaxID=2498704 RepID=UPI000FD7F790|nr:hypothetical protein [Agromyces sp. LHK192]